MNAWKQNAIECACIAPFVGGLAGIGWWFMPSVSPGWSEMGYAALAFIGWLAVIAFSITTIACVFSGVSSFITWTESRDFKETFGKSKE